jgi:4'-phosphopantetheinyl transferase
LNLSTSFSLELYRKHDSIKANLAFVYADHYANILSNIEHVLHAGEIAYFTNLKAEKRRLSYLIGRYAAKTAICQYLSETDMTAIAIERGIFDQPLVKFSSADCPDVTISHCDHLAVGIAFEPGHIMGVDIECIDLSKTHVFRSQLTDPEVSKSESNFDDYRIGYHLMWTAKESLSKAIKCGLTVPFSILEIDQIDKINQDGFVFTFKNFAQYKCFSWLIKEHLLSIVLPRKTETDLDIPSRFN